MIVQVWLMMLIGFLCLTSALNWWISHGAVASGIAFLGFAIGYFALAAVFDGG